MEAEAWSDPEALALLNQFVIIALYADDQTVLSENEWVTSKVDGKVKKTMGKINQDFQLQHFKTNALPYYVVLDNAGKPLTDKGIGYVGKAEFIEFLKKGLGQ
jgi:thiol:disulfide interchange protein DsbD